MSPVPVTIQTSRPPAIRPALPTTLVATTALVIEPDADALMEGSACSCAARRRQPELTEPVRSSALRPWRIYVGA
ncbi:hypothetical protein SAMN05216489_04017 [Streptomyces sp. 3213]|uniref:hypothetical protein n=1 Tax=Streptomyces sp. 3213.3 TaxID=1855348 RepID=UPI00089ABB03|nr:hypothetical protein [Streptomyces sp. 3213.3]SED65022.1 hypothetical protein SAMN05216489_04017 [Streptomyces sp. 3213] [Streptomyces sp. 3213.3]